RRLARCTLFPYTTLFRSEATRMVATPARSASEGRNRDFIWFGFCGLPRPCSPVRAVREAISHRQTRQKYSAPRIFQGEHRCHPRSEEHTSELQSREKSRM